MSEEVENIESERLNKEPDGAEVVDDQPVVTEVEEPTKSDNEETAEDIIEEISKEEKGKGFLYRLISQFILQ